MYSCPVCHCDLKDGEYVIGDNSEPAIECSNCDFFSDLTSFRAYLDDC